MANHTHGHSIGSWLGPPRFLVFLFVLVALVSSLADLLPPIEAFLTGFDIAALVFILSTAPLFQGVEANHMREAARRNDANRWLLLAISGILSVAVLCAIALEMEGARPLHMADIALVIGSLAVTWIFGNLIYALHYAHIFYVQNAAGKDAGGISFPATKEPDYWDFVYFAFTLGMTFQTSDVEIASRTVRRVVIVHCAVAFVFNIGVLAFTINVLGS